MLALGIAASILGAFAVLYLVFFMVAPDRAKDFAGTVSMWARSLARSRAEGKGRKHRRRTDPPDAGHEHARSSTPRKSLLMTMRDFAVRPGRGDSPEDK